ncbi:AMP-binding protein [Nocardioides sp. AX2bis]|uniref:AMP-binding protein n=1 Tax=Nocardioides sp. AX2bis TaxID=2653157 RepID=UPI0012F22C62|nr:AMP-binding protein [Nocardioides sp. AX2bis]VXB88011.1 Acetyl-coenzyme A synthetase [Nocardioides sp. AX2bis]
MSDNLSALIAAELVPLRPEWISQQYQDEAAEARALDAQDPDLYWEWVAARQRWQRPWTTLRRGELGDFEYYVGGRINVADNCVDRWAEDPAVRDRPAVIWEGEPGDTRTVTYAELADQVGRLAAGLLELGVRRGDVVAIYLPNTIEAFVAVHACNRIGAIYTILFSGFSEEATRSRLEQAEATVVIVADGSYRRGRVVPLLETLRAARARLAVQPTTVVLDRTGSGTELVAGEVDYGRLVDAQTEWAPMEEMDPNEPAFLIFTSGTSAKPKGVVHSVGGFLVGTWANAHWQVGPEEGDVYWVAADVGWLTFPIQAVVGGLANGMTVLCYEGALDTPTDERFFEVCEKHGVTKVLAAPTILRVLRGVDPDKRAAHPLSPLKLVTAQGEPLDSESFTWATENLGGGVPVINAYGQTETGSTWTYPIYGVDALKAGSAGTPVPGHEYAVVDAAGRPVPAGVKGDLVITRPFPTLARTVWKDPQRYHDAYFSRFPGMYATNDEAVVDGDGHLWVLGRSDDVINIAAHRISTMEIEEVVGGVPGVLEAAVVGVPDPTKGTVPVAFVRLAQDAPAGTEQAIQAAVPRELGRYVQLARVYVAGALPRTRTGKTMRRLLRDVATTGRATGDTSAVEDVAVLDEIIALVSKPSADEEAGT